MRSGVALMYAFNQRVTPDGRKRVDLVDRYGSVMRNAYVMSGAGMPISVPLEKEVPVADYLQYPIVVVGFMRGDTAPIVLGSLDCRDISYTGNTDVDTKFSLAGGTPTLTNAADVDTDEDVIGMEEVALASPRGGRVILKHNGRVVLAGTSVSIQLPEGSYLRLARGGDTAGRVPLVEPLVTLLDDMGSKINDLQAEIAALKATLTGPFSILLEGVAADPETRIVTAATPTFPLITASILDVTESTNQAIQPIDPTTIAAATLRIGSETEG